jgi:hypothetical protein
MKMKKEREVKMILVWVGSGRMTGGTLQTEDIKQGVYQICPGDIKGGLDKTRETIFEKIKEETGLVSVSGTIYWG